MEIDRIETVTGLGLYDPVTGLPNQSLFRDRLKLDVTRAMRTKEGLAVLCISFEIGKESLVRPLLLEIATRLRRLVQAEETIARVGGGEFGFVLGGFANAQQIVTRTQAIMTEIRRPFAVTGKAINVSMGVAIFPRDLALANDLFAAARSAAQEAIVRGPNTVRYCSQEIEDQSAARQHLESRLRGAMRRNELCLEYQPKYSLGTGMACGAEALLRWTDSEQGRIPPEQFIPIAEETEVILGLGSWVLRRACSMLRERSRHSVGDIPIAINLSARQFAEQDVEELICGALEESGIAPSLLHLEITEELILKEGVKALHTLRSLKDLGVQIAIDDFGTGHTCLRDLKNLPVDYLKIDECFIRAMREDDRDQAIVESIVRMGHRLGFRVVAEGVETQWELKCLREMGCDEAQGYLFERPITESEFVLVTPTPVTRRHPVTPVPTSDFLRRAS